MAAQRYLTKEKASVEIYGRAGNIIANLHDVSVTGACIEWFQENVELRKGDLVRVTVVLKAVKRKHNLNAEVIWRDGKKSGLSFIKSEQVLEKMMEKEG